MNISTITLTPFESFNFQYTSDGYINISKLCKVRQFLVKDSVKELITVLEAQGKTVIQRLVGGNKDYQGTYVLPELALLITSLVSSELSNATKEFINKYFPSVSTSSKSLVSNKSVKSRVISVDGYSFQCREDDYVNLTKMCQQVNKKLKRFLDLDDTKAKLDALVSKDGLNVLGLQTDRPLIERRMGGTPTEQGTYGHPIVAVLLAQWLSPEFAVAVAKLTHQYLKADVTLATDILDRATPEQVNAQGQQLANVIVEKADEKTEGHIQARLNTKNTNRELNRALAECPNISRAVFSMAQNSIYNASYGKTLKSLKKERGLVKKDESIRDTLTTKELVHLAFCESLSADVLDTTKPSGDVNCSKSVYDTSKQVKDFAKRLVKAGSNK